MKLTSENVEKVFFDCLFTDEEIRDEALKATAVIVEGILAKFGFHPGRLAMHKDDIFELLHQLPEEFDSGGGWSFLNACVTRSGEQWGEHQNMEQLLVLGIATDQATILMPREMWKTLPGGMPYFAVHASRSPTLDT